MAKLLLWKQMEITGDAITQKGSCAARTETQPDAHFLIKSRQCLLAFLMVKELQIDFV